MLKQHAQRILLSMTLLALPFIFISATSVHAQSVINPSCDQFKTRPDSQKPEVCRENEQTRGDDASDSSFLDFVTEFVDILLLGITIAAVIMLIVGGIKYILSTGDPAKTTNARNTIIYALVGIVVAVFARVIVLFVLDRL
ncbi:MAG: pilin [Actinobacteria bacterium]|nr:pilin [Actinomycetota bacterium]